jgi:hypothetical protein
LPSLTTAVGNLFHSITIDDQPDAGRFAIEHARRSSMSNQPRADILQRKSITTPRFAPISLNIAAPSGMKIALENSWAGFDNQERSR